MHLTSKQTSKEVRFRHIRTNFTAVWSMVESGECKTKAPYFAKESESQKLYFNGQAELKTL